MDIPEIKNQNPEARCKCCLSGCKSKTFKIITAIIGLLLIILASFAGGVAVGLRKAKFSYAFGQNYERNFIGERPGMPGGGERGGMMGMLKNFEGRYFRNAHGVAGTIISISNNNLVVKDRDNKENTVAVTDKTIIKNGRNDVKLEDLKQGDQIVVMGRPEDSGVVNATLIRVFAQNNQ